MSLPDIRELIKSFDSTSEKSRPLDLVLRAEQDVADVESREGQESRIVCRVLRSLCTFCMTSPSLPIAKELEDAATAAGKIENPKLALFANWYGACTRLAWVVVRGERSGASDSALTYCSKRLGVIATMARLQRMTRLHAVATATGVECLARLRERPDDFNSLLNGALELLGGVNQGDTRVAERMQLMRRIRAGAFDVNTGGFEAMPSISNTYFALMWKPGDLATAIQYA
jgi:hypothetical protein